MDGEELNKEDEEFIILKLLAYHPHAEDKIGCGLQAIMVMLSLFFPSFYCLLVLLLFFFGDGWWEVFWKCLNEVEKQG